MVNVCARRFFNAHQSQIVSDNSKYRRMMYPSFSCNSLATTFLQNFINFFQSAADLLCFVSKYKMAAVTILNFIFVRFYGTSTCRTSNLAILNLLFLSILVTRSTSGSSRRHYSKISFIYGFYANRRLSYCCLCKNPRWRPLKSIEVGRIVLEI